MYTCKTCKHLCHSKAIVEESGSGVSISSPTVIDAICEWHCPYCFFSMKPIGESCEHWKYMHGKHWL